MELVTQDIQHLTLQNEENTQFIQRFSKLNLDNLKLENESNILVGHIFLHTRLVKVNNPDKKYFIAVSDYYTDKKRNYIYPLSCKLNLAPEKIINNPKKYWHKYLKDNFSFTKKILDGTEIFQVHLQNNVVIYLVCVSTLTKKIKEMKKTSVLHFYTDPTTGFNIKNLYNQITSEHFNSLNKRFFFFYNNIKVFLKEKNFLQAIN